jgi:hypothetical protein
MTAYTRWVLVPKSVYGVDFFSTGSFQVDRMFWHHWFIWTMAVAGVSFKCLLIASSVRPVQVIRCPSLTACNIAEYVGLNRPCARSGLRHLC